MIPTYTYIVRKSETYGWDLIVQSDKGTSTLQTFALLRYAENKARFLAGRRNKVIIERHAS
jgi:hypothetical protein